MHLSHVEKNQNKGENICIKRCEVWIASQHQ